FKPSIDAIPLRCLVSRHSSRGDGAGASTPGYVKLLLPPRQSRGNSHFGLAPRRTIGFIVAAGDKSPRTFGAAWRSFPQIRRDDLPSGPILPRIRDIEPRCRFPRGRPPYRAEPLA